MERMPIFFDNERKYALQPHHRFPKLQGGISIGTTKLDNSGGGYIEGTASLVVTQKSSQKHVLLTAGHNVYEPPALEIGDSIVQPASDPIETKDVIGTLIFAKIDTFVDCALISLDNRTSFVRKKVLHLGTVFKSVKVEKGDIVLKVGVNGLREGRVVSTAYDGYTPTGQFEKHLLVSSFDQSPFSEEGDAGSLVVTEQNEIVGIIRSGRGPVSVVIPWRFILEYCDIDDSEFHEPNPKETSANNKQSFDTY